MATFSDYYAKQLADLKHRPAAPVTPAASPSGLDMSNWSPSGVSQKESDTPQSFLNWAIDILSRPLYGMTNVAEGGIESAVSAQKKSRLGDGGGAFWDTVGVVGGTLPRFLEGFFSNDHKVKRTFSKVLEQSTDAIGSLDPNYVDQQDNVNPVLKGTLGFAMDVLGDPLTWIPGAQIAAGAKLIGRGVKAGVDVAEGAVKGARDVVDARRGVGAAEDVAKATDAPSPVVARVEDNPFGGTDFLPVPKFESAPAPVMGDVAKAVPLTKDVVGSVFPEAAKVAPFPVGAAPRVVEDIVAKLPESAKTPAAVRTADEATKNAAEVGARQGADPLEMSAREAQGTDALRLAFDKADKASTVLKGVQEILKSIGTAPEKVAQTPAEWLKKVAKEPIPEYRGRSLSGGPVKGQLTYGRAWMMHKAEPNTTRGKQLKAWIDNGFMRSQAATAKPISDALAAYAARQQVAGERLSDVLGPKLVAVLDTKNSAKAMQEALEAVQKALSPETDLHHFFSSHPQLGNALRADLGIPKNIRPLPNVSKDLERVDGFLVAPRDAFGRPLNETPVQEAVRKAFGEEFGKAAREKYVVDGGRVRYTSHDPNTRMGRWWNQSNTMTQYTIYKNLMAVVTDRMVKMTGTASLNKLYGPARARAFRDALDSVDNELAEAVQTLGIPLHIGIGKQDLLPISLPELYRVVAVRGFADEDMHLLTLYNGGTAVAPTVLMQIAHAAVQAGNLQALGRDGVLRLRQELIDFVMNPQKPGPRGSLPGLEGKLPNNIRAMMSKDSTREYMPRGYVYAPGQEKAAKAAASRINTKAGYTPKDHKIRVVPTSGGAYQIVTTKGALIPALVDAVLRAQPHIAERIAENAAALAARSTREAATLANTAKDAVKAAVEANAPASTIVKSVQYIPKTVDEAAATTGALKRSVDAAIPFARAQVGTPLMDEARIAVKMGKDLRSPAVSYGRAVDTAAQSRANTVVAEIDEAFPEPRTIDEMDAARYVDEEANVPSRDISSMDTADRNVGIQRTFLTPVHERFNQYHGVNRIRDIADAVVSDTKEYLSRKTVQISALARKYPKSDATLNEALAALMRGDAPEHLAVPMKELSDILDDVLPVGDKGFLDSAMLRNEGSVKNINEALKLAYKNKQGPHDAPQFDYGAAKMEAKERFGKGATNEQVSEILAEQWKTWAVGDDALDFLSRMADTVATVTERKTFATSFVNRFTRLGLASETPKEGMVRIVANGDSTFRNYLPESFFVDKDLAGELHWLDALMRTSTQLHGELGHAVRKYFLPWQNMWKSNITVMRPGHHIRNAIGDGSITWIQRGNRHFLSSYRDAQRVLGFKNNYTDIDIIESLKRLEGGEFKLPQGGDVLINGTGRWAGTNLTNEGVHAILKDTGMLNNFHRAEDLLTDSLEGAGATRKITDLLSFEGTKLKEVAGGVSEYTAHMGRAQHFIQAMKQELTGKGRYGSVKSLDELIQKVAREVKRTHPDGQMLTTFERKYLRVIIPFYSWFGQTLPLALEASLRNPGRFMAMPKASYELAVSMGINPDTLSNPFPEDQLFPSFLTGGFFGPQFNIDGKYVNVNPGFAVTDVFGSIGKDPIRGVLGMTSPLLRAPVELATGGSMQTGGRINDTSDYLDQNLPFINYLANLSGVSPTGSVASLAQGKGLDPQLQAARGNKDGFDQVLTLANWLTGLNTQNWSRPNFVNFAEIEKRNRAGGQ